MARVRETGAPFFLVLNTYRFSPHSKSDDQRDPAEIEERRAFDPLLVAGARLDEDERQAIEARCEERLAETVEAADEAPARDPRRRSVTTTAQPQRGVQALNEALHAIFAARDDVVLLGEDVLDPYGGAFKVTAGLSDAYPDRVLTTPISEAALFGVAAGMALRGQRPIVEIMFGDFVALGLDQVVNGISKFREMYDDQVTVPLVVRTPMGARRGYGPTHSQSLEKLLLGIPNICVVACSECHDVGALLTAAVDDERPVFFVENKLLYGRPLRRPEEGHVEELAVRESGAPYPALSFSGTGFADDTATIVTYGGMLPLVLEAATELILEHEVFCEIVALSQLVPMELEAVLESVARTGGARDGGGGDAHRRSRRRDRRPRTGRGMGRPARARAACRGPRRDHPVRPRARGRDAAERAGRRRRSDRARRRLRLVLEIVLTREDANTEHALLAEWLVEDRAEVAQGQPVCVVETTKATVEVESPGAGTIVQLFADGSEVELGTTIAYVAESADELASLETRAEEKPALKAAGERKATRKAVELADQHGVDLAAIDKRGFVTEKDVQAEIDRRRASDAPSAEPLLAGVSTEGVTLPATFDPEGAEGTLDADFVASLLADPDSFRALPPADKVAALRGHGAVVGEGVDLGEGSLVTAKRIVFEDGVRLGPRATVVCEETVAIGEGSWFRGDLELRSRHAFLGAGIHGGAPACASAAEGTGTRGRRSSSAISRSSATRCS